MFTNNNIQTSKESLWIHIQNYDPFMDLDHFLSGKPYDIFSNAADIGFRLKFKYINPKFSKKIPYLSYCYPRNLEVAFQGIIYFSFTNEHVKATNLINYNFDNLNKDDLKQIDQWIHHQVPSDIKKRALALFEKKIDLQHAYKYFYGRLSELLMYELLLCKFTQHPALLKTLLQTIRDKPEALAVQPKIIKAATETYYYGHILMELRDKLNQELLTHGQISIRTGFSEAITQFLPFIYDAEFEKDNKFITKLELETIESCLTIADYKALNAQKDETSDNNTLAKAYIAFTTKKTNTNPIKTKKPATINPQAIGFFAPSKFQGVELEKNEETPLLKKGLGVYYGTM